MHTTLLRPDQIGDYADRLKPFFVQALTQTGAVKVDQADSEAEWMLLQAQMDRLAVFVVEREGEVTFVLVFQFSVSQEVRIAEALVMAGRDLRAFSRSDGWKMILEWLRHIGVEYIESRTSERIANVLSKVAGFKTAAVVSKLEL